MAATRFRLYLPIRSTGLRILTSRPSAAWKCRPTSTYGATATSGSSSAVMIGPGMPGSLATEGVTTATTIQLALNWKALKGIVLKCPNMRRSPACVLQFRCNTPFVILPDMSTSLHKEKSILVRVLTGHICNSRLGGMISIFPSLACSPQRWRIVPSHCCLIKN
jgi:hypothetical protein